MSLTIYRKYRPQFWSDIAGQDHIKKTLAYEVSAGQIAHAYLLAGPRGVGKTTTARIFAKAINCTNREKNSGNPCNQCSNCQTISEGNSLDIIEMDAASHTGVDAVRENIIENARFAPVQFKYKVFIIDEVHMLSTSAFNALLKTLEEPPANVIFLLATTELQKLPATVISRCQRFDFRKISLAAMIERLQAIATQEKVKIDKDVLVEIARYSEGCLRDAESLLGKLLAVAGDVKKIGWSEARGVLPRSDWEAAAKFIAALVAGDAVIALTVIGEALDAGADVEQFTNEIIEILRRTMLVKLMRGNADIFKTDLDEQRLALIAGWAKTADLSFFTRALEVLLQKKRELRGSHPVQLPLELAAVIICEMVPNKKLVSGGGQKEILDDVAEQNQSSSHGESNQKNENEDIARSARSEAESDKEKITAAAATIEEVKNVWSDCVKKVSEVSRSLSFLLGAVRPVEVIGQKVLVGSGFRFHQEKINDNRTRQVLEDALSGALGRRVEIEGVTLEEIDELEHNNDAAMAETPLFDGRVEHSSVADVAKIAATFGGKIVG
jgi:DNA polymerase-3 subunit gamma/tau